MALRYFFVEDLKPGALQLDEDTSKHIIGVLRMTKGEEVLLTNGKGQKAPANITDDNRKRCVVEVGSIQTEAPSSPSVCIAISPTKNSTRFEWFLEKATEIGVTEIIPLLCDRTEKEKFRHDRMKGILVSAMLQSQQSWLPVLHHPTSFEEVVSRASQTQKFIAHCLPQQKNQLASIVRQQSSLLLIGPEGDFTPNEIDRALQGGFVPVALGPTRLRTETAGVVGAVLLKMQDMYEAYHTTNPS